MTSNRFNIPVYLLLRCFSEHAHSLVVDINDNIIWRKDAEGGQELLVKYDSHYDFCDAGHKKITISWHGERECENKWLKVGNFVINYQQIQPWKCRYMPLDNEYLINQRKDPRTRKDINQRILFPGETFGWFGKIVYEPYIGTRSLRYSSRTKSQKEIVYELIRGRNKHIGLDPNESKTPVKRKVKQ